MLEGKTSRPCLEKVIAGGFEKPKSLDAKLELDPIVVLPYQAYAVPLGNCSPVHSEARTRSNTKHYSNSLEYGGVLNLAW